MTDLTKLTLVEARDALARLTGEVTTERERTAAELAETRKRADMPKAIRVVEFDAQSGEARQLKAGGVNR